MFKIYQFISSCCSFILTILGATFLTILLTAYLGELLAKFIALLILLLTLKSPALLIELMKSKKKGSLKWVKTY